jgi:hypothetical protein
MYFNSHVNYTCFVMNIIACLNTQILFSFSVILVNVRIISYVDRVLF